MAHEAGIADGGLLKATHGLPSVEGGNPDRQPKGGQKHEGGERNDEAPVKAAAPPWKLIEHYAQK